MAVFEDFKFDVDAVPPIVVGAAVGVAMEVWGNRRKVTSRRVLMAAGKGAVAGGAVALAAPVVGIDVSDLLPEAVNEAFDALLPG